MKMIYGGGCPSPRRAKPAGEGEGEARGGGQGVWRDPSAGGAPLPPLGLMASRLALCARVLPEATFVIPSTTTTDGQQ